MFHSNVRSLTAPSRVSGVSLTKTVESGAALMVSWTTQSDVNITQYQVDYRESGITVWGSRVTISGSPPSTFTCLTGLNAGTEYNVRVRARSAAGFGEWSVEHTERTFNSEFVCCQLRLHL